jgi:hypothetical protein
MQSQDADGAVECGQGSLDGGGIIGIEDEDGRTCPLIPTRFGQAFRRPVEINHKADRRRGCVPVFDEAEAAHFQQRMTRARPGGLWRRVGFDRSTRKENTIIGEQRAARMHQTQSQTRLAATGTPRDQDGDAVPDDASRMDRIRHHGGGLRLGAWPARQGRTTGEVAGCRVTVDGSRVTNR